MNMRYVVKLTSEERADLGSVLRRSLVAAWKVQRAQAWLALDPREHVPEAQEVDRECRAWAERHHREQTGVDWHFTTQDARVKLERLNPIIPR